MKNEENCVEFQVSYYLKHAHVFRCYFNQACLPKLSRYFIWNYQFQVQEYDVTGDKNNDVLDFKFFINVPQDRTVTSLILMLGLNFQLKVCTYLFS